MVLFKGEGVSDGPLSRIDRRSCEGALLRNRERREGLHENSHDSPVRELTFRAATDLSDVNEIDEGLKGWRRAKDR